MARYTATTTISFSSPERRMVVVESGSVQLAVWTGTEFANSETLNQGAYEVFTKNARIRFTPSGGAAFWVDESEFA